jgi:hypothetical protein
MVVILINKQADNAGANTSDNGGANTSERQLAEEKASIVHSVIYTTNQLTELAILTSINGCANNMPAIL